MIDVRTTPFKTQLLRFIGLWATLLIVLTSLLLLAMYLNTCWLLVGLLVIIALISAALWFIAGIERLRK